MNLLKIKSKTIGKFIVVVFIGGILLNSMFIIFVYLGQQETIKKHEINKYNCEIKNGGVYTFINGLDSYYCMEKSKDVEKICQKSEDCEGVCVINNFEKIVEDFYYIKQSINIKFVENKYNNCYANLGGNILNLEKFMKEVNYEIDGNCSSHISKYNETLSNVVVENNKIIIDCNYWENLKYRKKYENEK
ncbi:MAG: hypothetical protein KAT05_13570 [Spirochaetes bacterium]|nr:hypothetical protein [Spirochaetota bacterium]